MEYVTSSFTLQDTFGDHGLVSMIVLKKEKQHLFIDTWIMSCRVLKRGLEQFAMNSIIDHAKKTGFTLIKGEYIPTKKNGLVKDHYLNLGFQYKDDYWYYSIGHTSFLKTHIKENK